MKIEYDVSQTNFKLEGEGFSEGSTSTLKLMIVDIAQSLKAYLDADVELNENDNLGDDRRRTAMAIQLKMEIIIKDLSIQSELLTQLREGKMSPTDVGFPEFEYSAY